MRFVKWDYGAGKATEYRRMGHCNRCGQCCKDCKIILKSLDGRRGDSGTDRAGIWYEVEVQSEIRLERLFWQYESTERGEGVGGCDGLTDKCLCEWYENRDNICALWPMAPIMLEPFPECSYVFEVIQEWDIGKVVCSDGSMSVGGDPCTVSCKRQSADE